MGAERVYVASSWRNPHQPEVVRVLRLLGREVYDFRNPAPGVGGFSWSEIDPEWQSWTPAQYREALRHPIAARGYGYDIEALRGCDTCVMVLPCGRSSNWEFGYAMGQGKRGVVVQFERQEPELMYREAEIVTDWREFCQAFGAPDTGPAEIAAALWNGTLKVPAEDERPPMPAVDQRSIVLPLQLLTHVRLGDTWHFQAELMPFKVTALVRDTGVVTLERDWHGVTYIEWIRERAGVSRG